MKKVFAALAVIGFVLLSLGQAQALPLNNFGFETGALTGWTTNGNAEVVTAHTGYLGTPYGPVEGNYFARITAGSAEYYYTLTQSFSINQGQTLAGWAAFDYRDYHSFDDTAVVKIMSLAGAEIAKPWSVNGLSVPDYYDGPWTEWSWTAPEAGTYLLYYGVKNNGDEDMSSCGLFDAQVSGVVPEPASMGLLGMGLLGLVKIRRRKV